MYLTATVAVFGPTVDVLGLVIEKVVVVKISGREAFLGAQALCYLMVRNCIILSHNRKSA